MLLDVIKVTPLDNFCLHIIFENGEERLFNFNHLLTEKPFSKISRPSLFSQAKIEYGTVTWPNNIDISPEYLYSHSTPISKGR